MMDTESLRHSPGDIFSDTVSLIKGKVIQEKAIAFTSAQPYASWSERLLARGQFFSVSREYSIGRWWMSENLSRGWSADYLPEKL